MKKKEEQEDLEVVTNNKEKDKRERYEQAKIIIKDSIRKEIEADIISDLEELWYNNASIEEYYNIVRTQFLDIHEYVITVMADKKIFFLSEDEVIKRVEILKSRKGVGRERNCIGN